MNGTYSTPPSQTGSQSRGYVSPVISVSDLTQKIKRSLETSFPLLCIEGEVSNFKRQASGHLYFSLKDSQAQIAAVMFRSAASQLARLPAEGDQVTVKAQLTVYPARGSYQLIVQELTLSGSGQLLLQLEKLKENYRKLGYFDAERKKKLPEAPKRIGVVTSPTGAVIRDILNVLNRRHLGFHVILNPVKVQGEGAAEEIALAIDQMNAYGLCDVLIVARGGGSIEDLWAFNTEHVVEAIYRSEIPVISAVGHETDHTLADFVADVRAPTPSAAAEIVLEETASRRSRLDKCREQCIQALDRHLVFARRRLEWLLSHPLLSSGEAILRIPYQKLDELREELDRGMESRCERTAIALRHAGERLRALRPQNQIDHLKQRVADLQTSVDRAIHHRLAQCRQTLRPTALQAQLDLLWRRLTSLREERLRHMLAALEARNPKGILSRGYSILFSKTDGKVISSVNDVAAGDALRVVVSDGDLDVEVQNRVE